MKQKPSTQSVPNQVSWEHPEDGIAEPISLQLTLPLPAIELSPNSTYTHWAVKAKAKAEYQASCGWCIREFLNKNPEIKKRLPMGAVFIDLEFFMGNNRKKDGLYRPRDEDNAIASIKGVLDALQEVGVLENDSKRFVTMRGAKLYSVKKEHKGLCQLVVTITEKPLDK